MELWIRSQDRESLMKVNILDKYGLNIVTFDNEYREIYLGRYVTEERALEVLDEIQNILQPKITYHQEKPVETIQEGCYQLSQKVNVELQELSTYVYEMPKE